LFVALYYDRFGSFKSIFIGSLFIVIALAGFIVTRHPTIFLLFAALFSIGLAIVGISAPLGVFKITPTDFIGTFTGIRTFVMQISEAVMTLSLGLLLAAVSLSYIFVFVLGIVFLQVFFSRNAFGKEDQNDA
jgi:predicted MFS family arabinose efflux permease